jgi:hypothetical protein
MKRNTEVSMTYGDRSKQVALEAGIAATVLLSDNDGLVMFHRRWGGLEGQPPLTVEGVPVRIAGVVGATGRVHTCALDDPMDCSTTDAIADAFATYVRAVTDLEIDELNRLFALADSRLN